MEINELVESVGHQPDFTECGILGQDNQYANALTVGYGLLSLGDDDYE